jgi:transcriptional regulator with XRE-family HTH domain
LELYLWRMEAINIRLKSLREKAGLLPQNLADEIGINGTWFDELEAVEGALEESLDLEQIRKLALLLGVGLSILLTGSPLPPDTQPLSFKDLARHLRRRLESETSLDVLEDKAGWELAGFLKRPDPEGWGQRVGFFRDVCAALGLDWLGILAYGESAPE